MPILSHLILRVENTSQKADSIKPLFLKNYKCLNPNNKRDILKINKDLYQVWNLGMY